MAFEMSLLEVLDLAKRDKATAIAEARKLIVPWNPEELSFQDLLERPYQIKGWLGPINCGNARSVPPLGSASLEDTIEFFVHRGGAVLLQSQFYVVNNVSVIVPDIQKMVEGYRDDHFTWLPKPILPGGQNEMTTSLFIGRVPEYRITHVSNDPSELGEGERASVKNTTITDSVIVYVESGMKRRPAFSSAVKGNQPVLEDYPLRILSVEAGKLFKEVYGFTEQLILFVPPYLSYLRQ